MTSGPHVFGDGRIGLWVAENGNLTDKLKHYLPRLRGAIPNLTDLFLPPTATRGHRDQVRAANFFCHMYDVPHGRSAATFAQSALVNHARIAAGALELNIEGLPDETLAAYITDAVAEVRKTKPRLPLRINVVPYKGQYLPMQLFQDDPQLFLITQCYGGNMEALYAADEVLENVYDWGFALSSKLSAMHAVMCAGRRGNIVYPRQIVLPEVRTRGSFYIDDLLLDAGLLPA